MCSLCSSIRWRCSTIRSARLDWWTVAARNAMDRGWVLDGFLDREDNRQRDTRSWEYYIHMLLYYIELDTCDIVIIDSHQWSSVVHSASDPYRRDPLRCSSRGPQAGRWQRVRWLETATTGAEHYVPQLGLQSFSFRFDARLPRIWCQAANKSIWWYIIWYVAWKPLTCYCKAKFWAPLACSFCCPNMSKPFVEL